MRALNVSAALACFALAACGSGEREPPFNEQFETTVAEIENKAARFEAEAANNVNARVAELEEEARQLRNAASGEQSPAESSGTAEEAR